MEILSGLTLRSFTRGRWSCSLCPPPWLESFFFFAMILSILFVIYTLLVFYPAVFAQQHIKESGGEGERLKWGWRDWVRKPIDSAETHHYDNVSRQRGLSLTYHNLCKVCMYVICSRFSRGASCRVTNDKSTAGGFK